MFTLNSLALAGMLSHSNSIREFLLPDLLNKFPLLAVIRHFSVDACRKLGNKLPPNPQELKI